MMKLRLGFLVALAVLLGGAAIAGTTFSRQNYTPAGGVATNASWVGPWILAKNTASIGYQVTLTGTGAPVGTWGADITDDDNPITASYLGATALTLTADMTAQNPVGDSANISYLFMFDPAPPAKWMRFKFTRASGGSASLLLKIGIAGGKGSP